MKSKVNKKIYKALTIAHKVERRAIFIAFTLILGLCFLYIYFVASAVVSTVVYKEARINIAKVHSDIASLETAYIKEKQVITNELASSLGLNKLTKKTFLNRTVHVGRAE